MVKAPVVVPHTGCVMLATVGALGTLGTAFTTTGDPTLTQEASALFLT